MRHFIIILLTAIILPSLVTAQELPQFTYTDFDGWTYNNPGRPLNADNISGSKIVLYRNGDGVMLMLKSVPFGCQGIDSIAAEVIWYTPSFNDPNFVLSRTALTLALDDNQGNPLDSVTCTPTTPGTRTHVLNFSIAVPAEVDSISMRLVSWNADVTSCGAVRRALFQAVQAQETTAGDMNGDSILDVSDVTKLISLVLNGNNDANAGDMNADGVLDVSDVTKLIAMVLSTD